MHFQSTRLAAVGVAVAALASPATAPVASAAPIIFEFTGGFQTFVAPVQDTYVFTAFGAQGGNGTSTVISVGGRGAMTTARFFLGAGNAVDIAVAAGARATRSRRSASPAAGAAAGRSSTTPSPRRATG